MNSPVAVTFNFVVNCVRLIDNDIFSGRARRLAQIKQTFEETLRLWRRRRRERVAGRTGGSGNLAEKLHVANRCSPEKSWLGVITDLFNALNKVPRRAERKPFFFPSLSLSFVPFFPLLFLDRRQCCCYFLVSLTRTDICVDATGKSAPLALPFDFNRNWLRSTISINWTTWKFAKIGPTVDWIVHVCSCKQGSKQWMIFAIVWRRAGIKIAARVRAKGKRVSHFPLNFFQRQATFTSERKYFRALSLPSARAKWGEMLSSLLEIYSSKESRRNGSIEVERGRWKERSQRDHRSSVQHCFSRLPRNTKRPGLIVFF